MLNSCALVSQLFSPDNLVGAPWGGWEVTVGWVVGPPGVGVRAPGRNTERGQQRT